MVFWKHKYCRSSYIEWPKCSGEPAEIKVKLQFSLTRHQIVLLEFANSQLKGPKNVKFTNADMHRALKVLLDTPIRTKSILKFNTKMEVLEIMNLADDLDNSVDWILVTLKLHQI